MSRDSTPDGEVETGVRPAIKDRSQTIARHNHTEKHRALRWLDIALFTAATAVLGWGLKKQ